MLESNPYRAPSQATEQPPAVQVTRKSAAWSSLKRGAKRGAVIGFCLSATLSVVMWSIALSFESVRTNLWEDKEELLAVCAAAPLGVLFYTIVGTLLGGAIGCGIGWFRWKPVVSIGIEDIIRN